MKAKNKWNSKIYNVVEIKDTSIILKRTDGSQFEINKSEFNFSYRIIENQAWDNGWDKLNMKEVNKMDFFKKTWVVVMAFVFIIIGTIILILGGTTVVDINNVVELIGGVLSAIGLLIVAIKKLLQKKDTATK